jgi:hypothetical protein
MTSARLRYAAFLAFPCFFASLLPFLASSQEQPSDAVEITRDLLFLAPQRMEAKKTGATFLSRGFRYTFAANGEWTVEPLKDASAEIPGARRGKAPFTWKGAQYALVGHSDDDRAMLEVRKDGDAAPLGEAFLWNRESLAAAWFPALQKEKRGMTAEQFRQDLEVADPLIYAMQVVDDLLWVALGHSTGEAEVGLGTVIRFDLAAKQAKLYQPPEVATCAVTQMLIASDNSVWFAAQRQYEGTILPCAGLMRLDPSSGEIGKIALASILPADLIVTVIGEAGGIWVGTDSRLCKGAATGPWQCWRVVPTVALKSETPVSNRPGEKPSGKLAPGDYEVLWANVGFYEVATKDSLDAWLAADDFAEASARNFDAEPYKLLNTASPPAAIHLLDKPGGEPAGAATTYRARLEKLPAPQGTPAGWVRVRARIGWIPRGDLQVVPKLVPVESAAK